MRTRVRHLPRSLSTSWRNAVTCECNVCLHSLSACAAYMGCMHALPAFTVYCTVCRVPSFDAAQVIHSFAGARAKSDRNDWIIEASKVLDCLDMHARCTPGFAPMMCAGATARRI